MKRVKPRHKHLIEWSPWDGTTTVGTDLNGGTWSISRITGDVTIYGNHTQMIDPRGRPSRYVSVAACKREASGRLAKTLGGKLKK
jgi:hypothetical protein